jgi:hypothetical protein
MEFINLTPHAINLNDGRSFPPSGQVARIATGYSGEGDIRTVTFGKPMITITATGETAQLPPVDSEVFYIVSGIMAKATIRPDFVAPATGHPDAVRENGQIKSVPFFVQE